MRSVAFSFVSPGPVASAAMALILATILSVAVPPAVAEPMILDGDDVTEWVRVLDSSSWKYRDACLQPNALLKFNLDWHWTVTDIASAQLELFVEKAQPGDSIYVWHVDDDSWSYGLTDPEMLRQWPVSHLIGAFGFNDSTALEVDITGHLQEEVLAKDSTFSIKITGGSSSRGVRVASPLALVQRMRPRIEADVVSPLDVMPPPDLAVSTADLRISPACPLPGQAVTLQAWVRNLGPQVALPIAIPVSFWDGAPGVGKFIGRTVLPGIPPTGGSTLTTVTWPAVCGLHDLYVVVDSANTLHELDKSNNVAFREFEIEDSESAANTFEDVESFEYPGLHHWHTDFEVPKQYPCCGPKSFYLNRSGAEAYHGGYSMELFLDGTADDGTIWLERVLPVDPNSLVDVTVDFELFRYLPDIAFFAVAYAGVLEPEGELDFTRLEGPREGWALHSYHQRVYSGPYDQVCVAVGLTVSWEMPGTLFLDLIRVRAAQLPVGVIELPAVQSGASSLLLQNRPNPMGPLTTIAYRLAQEAPVSLHVYDAAGRRVTTLHDGPQRAGWHEVHWDGTNAAGEAMPAGVYFYRLDRQGMSESRKLLLVR